MTVIYNKQQIRIQKGCGFAVYSLCTMVLGGHTGLPLRLLFYGAIREGLF